MKLYESETVELKEIYTSDFKKEIVAFAITRSDVEEVLGSGTTHAINILKEMQEKELVLKIGNGKLTRYVIK